MRGELDRPTFPPAQLQSRRISEIYGFDGMLWRRILVDALGRLIVVGGGGGGGVGITDVDDNSLLALQTTLLAIDENYIFDGVSWIRWQGGVDNAPAPASPQGGFIAGIARTALPVYLAGDVVIPNFDTSGRLVTAAQTTGSPGSTITTPADTAIGIGATVALPAIPAGTRRMTVQNTGPAGSFIRVREVAAGAGRGSILGRFSSVSYGGSDGALAALEAEDVSAAVTGVGVATSAMTQFERT